VRAELTDKEEPDVTGLEALFEGYHEGHFMPGSDKNSNATSTNSTSNGKGRSGCVLASLCAM